MYMTDNTDPIKKEFIDKLEVYLADHLPPDISDGATLSITEIVKNNDQKLLALSIREPDIDISPNIYLEKYIEDYRDGRDIDDILQSIADMYMECRDPQIRGFDISDISEFDKVADRLVTKIINTDLNKEFLAVVPHKEFGDLSVLTQIRLDESNGMMASITIRDDILDRWDVKFDDVLDKANENDLTLTEPRLTPMDKVINAMRMQDEYEQDSFLPDPEVAMIPMYILSTEDKINGAKLLNQQEIMDKIAEFLDSDFIALPSSIHEAIVIPMDKNNMDLNELSMMVKSINGEVLTPTDVLSDHPYVYSKEERCLFFEKDGEQVKMQFTKQTKEKTRGVKDRLKEAAKKSKEQVSNKDHRTKDRSMALA